MKKFLIQSENGIPLHDFGFQMIEACKYKNWYTNGKDYFYELAEHIWDFDASDYIPIGSVEFVHDFLERYHNVFNVKPINIPEELFNFECLKRQVYYQYGTELNQTDHKLFVKSCDKVKGFAGVIKPNEINLTLGNYLVSEVIDIDSEWRAFVYNRELVGLQNYSGDFMMWPNTDSILRMIHLYNDCPPAYTLDIGINREVGTFLIEVHNFYSCGLYGFADNRILPDMFEKSFKWIINKYKVV